MLLVLSACVKNEDPVAGGYVSAVMEGEQTKTAVTDEGSFTWSADDKVWLGTTSGGVTGTLSSGAGTSKAEFSYDTIFGEMTNKAVYPYNSGHKISGNELSVVLPASYDLGSSLSNTNAVMYGVNVGGTFQFSHLAGVMRFKFKNVPVGTDKFKITLDKKVNGTFVVDLGSDQPIVEAGTTAEEADKTITLNFAPLQEVSDISLYIPLPVGTYASLALNLWAGDKAVWTYSNTVTNTISRKTLKLMPTITIDIDESTINSYKPFIELGAIRKAGDQAIKFYGKQYYRTPRYLRPTERSISIEVLRDCEVRVSQYDSDYQFIGLLEFASATPYEHLEFNLDDSCEYIRLTLRKDSALTEFDLPEVYISNVEDKEYREVRSDDEGYQRLIIPVQVGDEILPDYGVMVLPETYSNIGEPTRLIIFCHGAAVNYPSSVSRFVDSDINPAYWLKEGYAIMDIEGNPYDNTNEHFYIPAAKKSYEAAYNWVVNTYNICTDGVFLGGRSMGGGMCFDILQSSIPVVAACPVVPACNTLWYWNYCNADRKKFCSEKAGFIGEQPSWTSNKKMVDEEYRYLYGNFDKLMDCAPIWKGIIDLPSKDELFSIGRVSANVAYDEAEYEFYSKLSYWSKAPVKIFTCYEDTTVPYRRNAEIMYNMMQNAGIECELSIVHTDASAPHRYEQQDSNANINVTTRYGETMSAPWVYVDMLKWWRKYE